ncbi:MAG: CRTAC1 family protein [Chloroflexota bacterium]
MPRLILIILYLVLAITLVTVVCAAYPVRAPGGYAVYVNVTSQAGVADVHLLDPGECPPNRSLPGGSGDAWADYDNDGDIDLFVTSRQGGNRLYRNDGDVDGDGVPNFSDEAAAMGVQDPDRDGLATVFIDYDNDGDQDLFVAGHGGNKLYRNRLIPTGSVRFADVTDIAGIEDGGRTLTAAWADFDGDSFLDLYLTKHIYCIGDARQQDHLFRNNGDGAFTDVTGWLCPGGIVPCGQVMGLGFSAAWLDYDNDADLDLYLVNDNIKERYYHNVLWRNDGPDGAGGWLFTDVSAESQADHSLNGMGLGVGDYDNDGWLDLAFSHLGPAVLLRNNQNGAYTDVSSTTIISQTTAEAKTWATAFFDHDNDGWLDLLYTAGQFRSGDSRDIFFGNNGDGTFSDLSAVSSLDDPGRARNAAIADFDQDGFVDVFIDNYGQLPSLLHNQGNNNHWLTVTVEGRSSNRDGIGARLWLDAGGLTQMREINTGPTAGGGDYRAAYFGLGPNTTGTLTVRWPNGVVQEVGLVAADQILHLVEPQE